MQCSYGLDTKANPLTNVQKLPRLLFDLLYTQFRVQKKVKNKQKPS